MKITFRELKTGATFTWAGFECVKHNSKVAYHQESRREFFFNGREIVNVEQEYFTIDLESFYGVPDVCLGNDTCN
jgi:hypothetical protein